MILSFDTVKRQEPMNHVISRCKENYGTGREMTSLVLGLCESHQGYFQTN